MSQKKICFLFFLFSAAAFIQAQQTGVVAPEPIRLAQYQLALGQLGVPVAPAPKGEGVDGQRSRLAAAVWSYQRRNGGIGWGTSLLDRWTTPGTVYLVQVRLQACERALRSTTWHPRSQALVLGAKGQAILDEANIVWLLTLRSGGRTQQELDGLAEVALLLKQQATELLVCDLLLRSEE